jgi:AAA family ATP:ADP antiporter
LFGLIGVGGTLGALAGSAGTAALAHRVGEVQLIPVSAVLLVAACVCALRTMRLQTFRAEEAPLEDASRIGGRVFSGFTHVWQSPYLRGICLIIFLTTLSASLAYFAQGTIIEKLVTSRDRRAALFASIDLVVNSATILLQILLTGRIIRMVGVGWSLAILPLVFTLGFACLAAAPALSVLFAMQVIQRALVLGLARPAQESLFTVVSREDKYKAKSLVDTCVYSGGDAAGAALFSLLTGALGLDLRYVLLLFLPTMLVWLAVALYLGRQQQRRGKQQPCSA